MRLLSRLGLGMAAFALVAGAAGPARAAVLWTLTISPSTVTAGVQTTFSLRASLTLLGEIRCVEVGVPDNFLVTGAAVTGSNAGDSWVSQVVGNDVFVRTTSGGDRLQDPGHYVDFTITATAWTAGSLAWASHTHDREDCTGPESLLSVPPVVLVLASSATPTPAPTVTPTVAPTPRPTATPSILPTLPPITILPTPSPSATLGTPGTSPRASAVTSPSAAATPDPESPADASPSEQAGQASSTPVPSADSGEATGAAPPGSGAGGDGGAAGGRLIAEPPASGDGGAPGSMPISLGALGLLGSIDIWIVPGFLLGVPGMLVIAFVMLQAIGALAWIPAIRRLRGEEPEAAVA